MEREKTLEKVREKEKEPVMLGPDFPYVFRNRAEQKKHLNSLPRVIHMDETPDVLAPWAVLLTTGKPGSGKTFTRKHQIHLDWHYKDYKELKYPIYTMTAHLNPGKSNPMHPGEWSGHRHFEEAVFYSPGGVGWEEQDGRRWEWHGEGIVCVPSYAIHKHGVTEPVNRGMFVVISHIYEYLGIADFEQTNTDTQKRILESTKGQWPEWYGPPRDEVLETFMYRKRSIRDWDKRGLSGVYQRYLQTAVEENDWYRDAPRFVAADDIPWELSPQGKIKYLSHPWSGSDCCLKTLDCYLLEISPGSSSGKHRHVTEEIIVILEGEGFDIHDGTRYDWKENDLVCIPVMTEHQHFNISRKTVKIFGVSTRWYYYLGLGGIEQVEPCPEYEKGWK